MLFSRLAYFQNSSFCFCIKSVKSSKCNFWWTSYLVEDSLYLYNYYQGRVIANRTRSTLFDEHYLWPENSSFDLPSQHFLFFTFVLRIFWYENLSFIQILPISFNSNDWSKTLTKEVKPNSGSSIWQPKLLISKA